MRLHCLPLPAQQGFLVFRPPTGVFLFSRYLYERIFDIFCELFITTLSWVAERPRYTWVDKESFAEAAAEVNLMFKLHKKDRFRWVIVIYYVNDRC